MQPYDLIDKRLQELNLTHKWLISQLGVTEGVYRSDKSRNNYKIAVIVKAFKVLELDLNLLKELQI